MFRWRCRAADPADRRLISLARWHLLPGFAAPAGPPFAFERATQDPRIHKPASRLLPSIPWWRSPSAACRMGLQELRLIARLGRAIEGRRLRRAEVDAGIPGPPILFHCGADNCVAG